MPLLHAFETVIWLFWGIIRTVETIFTLMFAILIMELKHPMSKVNGDKLPLAVFIHYAIYLPQRLCILSFQIRKFCLISVVITTAYLSSNF